MNMVLLVSEWSAMKTISRRRLLECSILTGAALAASRCAKPVQQTAPDGSSTPAEPSVDLRSTESPGKPGAGSEASSTVPPQAAYLAVVRGEDASQITARAIAAIGGIERFVKPGYNVVIKPNICSANYGPEYAATTNPDVVAALVRLCLGAGAKRVRVMDYPFDGSPKGAYARSGIEAAVNAAGGKMELMSTMGFQETAIPNGLDITKWNVYQPALTADLIINVPIAKHHGLARLTLAGKNLMGLIESRGGIHRNMGQRLADLASLIRPQLTVIDAVRILMANGPTGGNLNDVKLTNTVIASHDHVACDAYATSLFGLKPESISYITASSKMGLGQSDLTQLAIEELAI